MRLRSQCTNLKIIIIIMITIIINNEVGCNSLFQILHLGVADNIDILIYIIKMIFGNAAAFYMCFQCIRDKSLLRKLDRTVRISLRVFEF